jgi:restriction system protein
VADVSAKRQGELIRGLLGILAKYPDGLPARDALARLALAVPPTPYEAADWPKWPGVRRFEKIVRFYTIDAVKAGWLGKKAGQWTITEPGLEALKNYPDPEQFAREGAKLYRAWRKANPKDEAPEVTAGAPSEPSSGAFSLEEAKEGAWDEVKAYLHAMPPYDFQELVAGLLKAMGYFVAWVSPPGADAGVDILAYTDPLGASGPRIKVQVKRVEGKVTADNLRSFMAVLGDQDVGIYVALGGFTSGAETEVRRQEKRKLTLIDLVSLYDLWVEHQHRVPEEYRLLLPLTPVHYLDRR